jgi:hypothetical protein
MITPFFLLLVPPSEVSLVLPTAFSSKNFTRSGDLQSLIPNRLPGWIAFPLVRRTSTFNGTAFDIRVHRVPLRWWLPQEGQNALIGARFVFPV